MLDLPKCPYCSKHFDYVESAKAASKREGCCRRCKKKYSVHWRASFTKTAIIAFLLLISLNTLIFFQGNNLTILPNLIVTVLAIIICIATIPWKVKLYEIEGQRDPEPKRKKNRHRHKKTRYDDVKFDESPLKGSIFDK